MPEHVAVTPRGATMALAEFVANLRADDIPSTLRSVLQTAVVDSIGCGLYGLTTQPVRTLHEFALEQGGPGEASLWASGGARISALNTVLVTGAAIHGFDFDDHSRAKIHPAAAILPVVLALAERDRIDGQRVLTALAAGYEVMNRVSLAANPNSSRMRGWHLTGTCGTFGAAAAASVLLGLDSLQTASALGLAGTQSSGLWAFTADGAMSKRLHPGVAAQNGLRAALLAQRGFHGPRKILEAEDGGFLAATSDDVRIDEVTRDLGSVWRAEGACFKPYACCGSNHASIDAVLQLSSENGFTASDVDRTTLGVSRVVERQTGFEYTPTTVLNAQMSIRYNVAVALIDGHALVEQFSDARIADPEIGALIDRIVVEVDAEMDKVYPELYAGVATIELKDGRAFRRRVDHSLGMPENRMSEEHIRQKFHSLAKAAAGEQGEALYDGSNAIFAMNADVLGDFLPTLGKVSIIG